MKVYIYASEKSFENQNSEKSNVLKFTYDVKQIDENGQRILFDDFLPITSIVTPSLRFTNRNHKAIYTLELLTDSQIQKLIKYWYKNEII